MPGVKPVEAKAPYGAHLAVLVAGVTAAVVLSVFASHAQGQPAGTTWERPEGPSRAEEGALFAPEPQVLAQAAARQDGGVVARPRGGGPLGGDAPSVAKTAEGEDLTRQEAPTPPAAPGGGEAGPYQAGEADRPAGDAPVPPPGSCDDPLALVDRGHALPRGYAPGDMVPLDPLGVRTLWGNAVMRRKAAEDLLRLIQAARAAGEDLIVASGYRSFEDQRAVHAELTGLYGEEAEMLSAPPGHSEHQLGTTVDFTNREARYTVGPAFAGTGAHRWLREHAHEYGFVQSYERGKEGETGYRAEAWHYRHVGAENARRLEGTDLSLRAFLLRQGVTPRCG